MSGADRSAVADNVEDALQGLGIEELNTRAGYRPGRGYVHPAEAADEILDEVLQPFLDDLQRRAGLGMRSAAVELATGILLGLYICRHGNSETLLEYCPDYAAERASTARSAACGPGWPNSRSGEPSSAPISESKRPGAVRRKSHLCPDLEPHTVPACRQRPRRPSAPAAKLGESSVNGPQRVRLALAPARVHVRIFLRGLALEGHAHRIGCRGV